MLLSEIKKLVEIDPNTPQGLRWKVQAGKNVKIGNPTGNLGTRGYFRTGLKGKTYYNHRLVYALYYNLELNQVPKMLDHIDRNKTNNNPDNLRPATNSQNQVNTGKSKRNTSGVRGVCFHKRHKKWISSIAFQGKLYFLGYYTSKKEAYEIYQDAAYLYFGEFCRSGIKAE